jgi:hypothetical protein
MFSTETTATSPSSSNRVSEYATPSEFCQIFTQNMEALYTLALALTANKAAAEACLLSALEECTKTAAVFRQWANSWSRLAVIESAIRMVKPLGNDGDGIHTNEEFIEFVDPVASFVSKLRAFDRFTFVLSVLDRYSVRDCAILLKCRPQEIRRARERAMEFIARAGSSLIAQVQPTAGARLSA